LIAESGQESASDVLVECIDRSLSDLKICPVSYVYEIAKESFGVPKEEIPENPDAFEEALQSLFGSKSDAIEMEMKKLIIETFRLRKECTLLELPELIFEITYGTKHPEMKDETLTF